MSTIFWNLSRTWRNFFTSLISGSTKGLIESLTRKTFFFCIFQFSHSWCSLDISFSLEKMASFSGQSGIEMVFFNPAPPLLEESEGNGKVKMTQVRLNYYNLSNEGMRFSLLISVPKKTFFLFSLPLESRDQKICLCNATLAPVKFHRGWKYVTQPTITNASVWLLCCLRKHISAFLNLFEIVENVFRLLLLNKSK